MARKKPAELIAGTFSGMPHAVMDSTAFIGASHHARSLLFELIRQHNGSNNGHFQLATSYLRRRGWRSNDTIHHAKAELITRQLVIKTRLGGLGAGPDKWAVTWLPISNYAGLSEVSASTYHPGAWHFLNPPMPLPPQKVATENCDAHPAERNGLAPPDGTGATPIAPPGGTVGTLSSPVVAPPSGNNVITNATCRTSVSRVVGKKGASGTRGYFTGHAAAELNQKRSE